MAVLCQSKLPLAKRSCISGALRAAVPGSRRPGDAPPSFPAKGYDIIRPRLKNSESFFSQGSNLCLEGGSSCHFPPSPPRPERRVGSEAAGWFRGLSSVS